MNYWHVPVLIHTEPEPEKNSYSSSACRESQKSPWLTAEYQISLGLQDALEGGQSLLQEQSSQIHYWVCCLQFGTSWVDAELGDHAP